jgi:hypothetical protein
MRATPYRRRWPARLAFGLAVVFVGNLCLFAQTDVTTTRVSGTVRGADKSPLPGVTVTARNLDTGLAGSAFTSRDGYYQIVNLPTGRYSVNATLSGFQAGSVGLVRLDLGMSPTIDFTLQLEGVKESVTASAEIPVVEVSNTTFSTTLQTEQLKNLPTNGRDFKNLVLLTPETRLDAERGNISIGGQRGIATNVTVDGVDYNNSFFGGTVGGAEGRAPLSLSEESIKEFSVITNGASVEFGRSGGGFVNVITKSGTNTIHGSGFMYWQPQALIANFADGREPFDQDKKQFGASLGGPLLKDKLFLFASYDQQDQNITVPIVAGVLNPLVFAEYPVLASAPNYVQTRNGYVVFGRADYQMTPEQRISGRVNYGSYDGENGTSSSQTQTVSHNGIEGMTSLSLVGQWSGQFSTRFLNDVNFNYNDEDTPREDKHLDLPEIQQGSFSYGEVAFLPIFSTTKRYEIADTATYLLQDQVLKAGVDYNDTSIDQIFKGNWRGVFVFNNTADLLAGRWFQYRQFGGLNGLTADEAGLASFGQKELAFFVQDQWFVKSNLTITAGLRYERLNNPNGPILNQNDVNPDGSYQLNGQIPDANNQWSPRIGASWSPDIKTVVRLAAGRFWSRTPAILFAQLFTSNGLRGTQYIISAPTSGGQVTGPPTDPLSPGWGDAFVAEGVERIDFTQIPTPKGLGVFAIDPNFEDPYTDRLTLGVERQITSQSSVSLDGTWARGYQLQRLTDINRVYSGGTAVNGLPLYSSTRPNPYYGRVTTSLSDATSTYWAVVGMFLRRFTNNLSASAVVTFSEDKDNDSNERNFAGIQAEDYNDLNLNWGYSARDQKWRLSANTVWTPIKWVTLAGSARYVTGQPYTPLVRADFNNDGESGTDRPTIGGYHLPRGAFRQQRFFAFDVRVAGNIPLGPGAFSVAVDCFNCTNASNRFVTNTRWGTGQTPAAGFGVTAGVGTPRTVQLSARYDF